MKTLGIIAEYNPFHNGHLYQIQKAKELTNADCVVIVMSGDFVQRGTPAWTDKYLRTKMALLNQADLVFEMPVVYASSSAETFALAGVSLLNSLGFVDMLCFGSECGDLLKLQDIATFMQHPPKDFYQTITSYTAKGFSFPLARKKAFLDCYKTSNPDTTQTSDFLNEYASILDDPNNILAIEYLKAIQTCNSPLKPVTIKRSDAGYHNTDLNAQMHLASASAIRQNFFDPHTLTQVQSYLPASVYQLLQKKNNRFPITENDFSDLLYYRLCHLNESDKDILDLSDELFFRIKKELSSYTDYRSFIEKIKTKQYTYTRISRVLLHLLLDIKQNDLSFTVQNTIPFVPYVRLLGFSKAKSSYLRQETKIPIITKPADGVSQICNFYESTDPSLLQAVCALYEKDLFASNLYQRVQSRVLSCPVSDEYHQKPVMLS